MTLTKALSVVLIIGWFAVFPAAAQDHIAFDEEASLLCPTDSSDNPAEAATGQANDVSLNPEISFDNTISLGINLDEGESYGPGEIFYISCLIRNSGLVELKDRLNVALPDGWQAMPDSSIELNLMPEESSVQIFGIRMPNEAYAGEYEIALNLENSSCAACSAKVVVNGFVKLKGVLGKYEGCCTATIPASIPLFLQNDGNTPLCLKFEASLDPVCPYTCSSYNFTLEPGESQELNLDFTPQIEPRPYNQHLFLNVVNLESGENLFTRAFKVHVLPPGTLLDDPFIRIPSRASLFSSGYSGSKAFGFEVAGDGYINENEDRYLDYCFTVSSNARNMTYDFYQRYFLGLEAPDWDVCLGDTNYNLTKLTQFSRYGRGGGFNIYGRKWNVGTHYTQNIISNSYNPHEACAYIEYFIKPNFSVSGNYLHKTWRQTPTVNIATCELDLDLKKASIQLEFGKNFLSHARHRDTLGFNFNAAGRCFGDTWYNIEKTYAGAAFFGYYNHLNQTSASIDFPIGRNLRCSLSGNDLVQHFHCRRKYFDHPGQFSQKTATASINYNVCSWASVRINASVLRANNDESTRPNNFFQKWLGSGFTVLHKGYFFNGSMRFGQQYNYITHHSSNLLQSYYALLGRDFTPRLTGSVFYQCGSLNYYDAKLWGNSIGGAFLYRYSNRTAMEFTAQCVTNQPSRNNMYQFSGRGSYVFKNLSQLQANVQYSYNQKYFPSAFMFLVSYTVPFGLKVGKRTTEGSIEGYVYDAFHDCPVSNAMINFNERSTLSNEQGQFFFTNVPVGKQSLRTEILPKNTITQDLQPYSVEVFKGERTKINIPIVPTCQISGRVLVYDFDESTESSMSNESGRVIQTGPLEGIEVFIERDGGKEIYRCTTNQHGMFDFTMLRPGNWRVTASSAHLPRLHYLNLKEIFLDIQPDENKELLFKVLPEERQIIPLD